MEPKTEVFIVTRGDTSVIALERYEVIPNFFLGRVAASSCASSDERHHRRWTTAAPQSLASCQVESDGRLQRQAASASRERWHPVNRRRENRAPAPESYQDEGDGRLKRPETFASREHWLPVDR